MALYSYKFWVGLCVIFWGKEMHAHQSTAQDVPALRSPPATRLHPSSTWSIIHSTAWEIFKNGKSLMAPISFLNNIPAA